MSRRFVILLMAAGIGTGWATAGEPVAAKKAAQKSVAEQAARLVVELGSDDFDVRERAVRQLEALGPAAGPTLQKAVANSDPEVRRLALQVAEKIARKMEAAEVLEPRRFRVAFRDVPLHVALAEFTRASGARIQLDQGVKNDRKVTLDTGYTTFWDAFDKFCAAAGLAEKIYDTPVPDAQVNYQQPWMGRRRMMVMWNGRWAPQQDDIIPALLNGQFVLVEAKAAPRPSFQAGALRFRALPAGTTLGRASTFKGDKELVFGLEILPEPALAWEKVQSLHIDKAIDDQGQNLQATQGFAGADAPANDEMDFFGGYDYGGGNAANNGGQRVPLRLALGRKPSAVLKELSGVATIKMQTGTEAIATIDNILHAREKSAKGRDGSFLKVIEVKREEGGKLVIYVKVEQRQDEEAVANPWGWGGRWWGGMRNGGEEQVDSSVSTGHLTLFDARGNLVRLLSKEQIQDENGVSEEYHFTYQVAKGQPDPAKLVLQGRRPVSIDVPFTLKDVPLRPAPGAPKPSSPPPAQPQAPGEEVLIDR
ncbi:MAG TPA: HEAT repeat domain-containing protein [Gemmataceae bacterium]|nr:HEAT repeat domain-containing protein [Gemmataceae bacterium]